MPDLVNGHQPEHSSVGGFQLAVQRRPGGLNPKSFGQPKHMTRPEDLTADQHAIVDQSDDVRDPADDSDEMNDATKMTDTYPEALDPKLQEAEGAIQAHRSEPDGRSTSGIGRAGSEEASGLSRS